MADAHPPPHDDGHRRGGTSRPAHSPELAAQREHFLTFEPVVPGTVRETIMASWCRSRDWQVAADRVQPQYTAPQPPSPLALAASPIVAQLGSRFAEEPVSLILTDADGIVLDRHVGDTALRRHLDRVSLAPGFSYAERSVGTNGIGTALEGRGPAQVFGHEHYVEHLEDLACAGAPIHHPTTGKVIGVIDLTCWHSDVNPALAGTASTMARAIETALLERTCRHELALLHDYLAACRRNRGPVFAISKDLAMLNDSARLLIDPADQAQLLVLATEALGSGKPSQFSCPLSGGATARVHCKPSWSDGSGTGGVAHVQLFGPIPEQTSRPCATPSQQLPGLVGRTALWTRCCREVRRHHRGGEWLMLEGEPGTGKHAIARAAHLADTPTRHLRTFDADDCVEPARWVAGVRAELTAAPHTGTVILRHVDRLPAEALHELTELLGATTTDSWVVATRTGTGLAEGELGALIGCFARSVTVPPLRHHIEDVPYLVPFLITRLIRDSRLSCSSEALRVLMRYRWPGNVEQLYRTIRTVVGQRRTGVIKPSDLPAEVQATSRRVLTPLESIECDAIVQSLRGVDGNRAAAARHLGMSRATIYRKIRDYGIVMPKS